MKKTYLHIYIDLIVLAGIFLFAGFYFAMKYGFLSLDFVFLVCFLVADFYFSFLLGYYLKNEGLLI